MIIEDRPRDYLERRVRAGLLEQNTVDLLRALDVGERLDREGLVHDGIYLRREGRTQHIEIANLTGRHVTIYGQQEVVKDLIAALLDRSGELHIEVSDVSVEDLESERPRIRYSADGSEHELECDFIAGCDGFHGTCRPSIPSQLRTEYEYTYPFGWLGILAEASPATDELIYAWHEHGFALYTMRSSKISRLYLQVPADEELERWSDERIWAELQVRLASEGWRVNEGPILEKGITPMRTFVCEPMRHGRLFLAGDAAHIVPPTGAKGLNLAAGDVGLLAQALTEHYGEKSDAGIDHYSARSLRRVWRAERFSWWFTSLMHKFPETGAFGQKMQAAELDYLVHSDAASTALAENYVGLPL